MKSECRQTLQTRTKYYAVFAIFFLGVSEHMIYNIIYIYGYIWYTPKIA